jgi:hypothetical protein
LKHGKPAVLRVILLALFLFPNPSAVAGTGGSISGTARDSTGEVVPIIPVMIRNVAKGFRQTGNAIADGYYDFATLAVSRYEIEIFVDGTQHVVICVTEG